MAHTSRGWITYTPSHAGWAAMSIKADLNTANANGQGLSIAPPNNNFWPLHHGDLRAVYGKDSAGYRDTMIVCDPGSSLLNPGATFQDEFGNVYTVTGIRQERSPSSHFK